MNNQYNTPYSNYSQSKLNALFSTDNWNGLSFSEKMSACQEIENRYAAEYNVQPCIVTHEKMEGACYGWQSGSTICLNSYLVQDGQFCTHFTDQNGLPQEIRTDALAPGWNTLDTLYHEGTHGIQERTGRMPSTYISPEMDGNLYRIQGIEKEAYAAGQIRTLNALSEYEKEVGHLDAGRNDYIASVKNDSFQSALVDAARNYNDPNIEQTLQDVISDRENNITRENATDSYKAINDLCDTYNIHSSVNIDRSENLNSGIQHDISSSCNITSVDVNIGQDVVPQNDMGYASIDDGMGNLESEDGVADDRSVDNETSSALTEDDGMDVPAEPTAEASHLSDELNDENSLNAESAFDDGFFDMDSTNDYGSTAAESTNSASNDGYSSGEESDEGYGGDSDYSSAD